VNKNFDIFLDINNETIKKYVDMILKDNPSLLQRFKIPISVPCLNFPIQTPKQNCYDLTPITKEEEEDMKAYTGDFNDQTKETIFKGLGIEPCKNTDKTGNKTHKCTCDFQTVILRYGCQCGGE
jgi:hypothetical protein